MTTDRTPAEPPRTVALVCPSCGSSYWSPEWEHCGACGTALKPYMEVVGLVVERELLSAQLAEQRSINAALTDHLEHCLNHLEPADDADCRDELAAARTLLADSAKAATEWRTQVAKEAVEAAICGWCARCLQEIKLGDPWMYTATDEDGEPVNMTCVKCLSENSK